MNSQVNIYRGKVDISFKRGNKVVRKETHNRGLSDMALLFAKAVSGNFIPSEDSPRLLDIGYIVPSATDVPHTLDNGVWQSILNEPAVIGGRQYKFDKTLNNWVAMLVSTVYYSDLNGGMIKSENVAYSLDQILESADNGVIQLKVRLCSYNVRDRKYFAEIDVTPDEIREIKDSTSAIFQWYTELLYDNTSTTSIESNVVAN